ncbi:MAG TPA: hypothetical protein VFV99_04420 [Kofleriaceae bacterium]|nr:hypothetical protein [Kofleriaceae bacterium]
MAAVLCLVLLPLMAAAGFMLGVVNGQFSAASLLGGVTFVVLGFGMFFGIFRMSRDWENEQEH